MLALQSIVRGEQCFKMLKRQHTLGAERDEFLLMGCDGLWRVFDPKDAVDFAMSRLKDGMPPEKVRLVLFKFEVFTFDLILRVVPFNRCVWNSCVRRSGYDKRTTT